MAPYLYRPEGWIGIGLWMTQALVVASWVSMQVDRVAQRALPLATLMGMSMTFPDQAPSRFSLALRTGTVRKLRAQIEDLERNGLGASAQEASVRAIELVTMLSNHERLTRGHTERVRAHAEVIAAELDLPEADRQKLAWGVLLHDIGKLTVPPEILDKDGPPTDEEWAVLARHPEQGAKIMEPLLDWLGDWGLAASQHHERWDGGGYPNGLAGTDISLAGRITAVADTYDVITSHRSYKAPMSKEAARKELVDCAGTQFDPAVVRAFLQASVRRCRRAAALVSWLPELPGLASITHAVATTPAVLATAAIVATAPLTGVTPSPAPEDLAFAPTTGTSQDMESTTSTSPTTAPTTAEPMTTTIRGSTESATIDTSLLTSESTTTTEPSTSTSTTTTESSTSTISSTSRPPDTTTPPPTTAPPPTTTAPTTTAPPTTTTTVLTTTTTTALVGPTANDDSGSQHQGTQHQYPVLSNDTAGDAPIETSTLSIVTPPTQGTAEPWQSTKIRYHADAGFTGVVTVTYRICDTNGLCDQAILTIELTP
jgi:HD-GYP domain-containing protein (c-di-GMP phosphodiesterase class II)